MGGRAIALVLCKAVAGVLCVKFAEQAVPGDLGNDRSRADAGGLGIPLHQRRGRQADQRIAVAVHQQVVGNFGKPFNRPAHRQECGLQNIDLIDFPRGGKPHRPADGLSCDDLIERLPLLFRELFGIIQPFDDQALRQNYRSRSHRSHQRTPARLVHPADQSQPFAMQRALDLVKLRPRRAHRLISSGVSSEIRPIFPPRNSSSSVMAARRVSASPPGSSIPRFFATRQSSP